ncbi:MAG: thioredoxin domain-containing protein [Candidatus Thermoplasmatota archaeon]|nr:thioredoxin domain-containing protein [Candidatus Thermoplasmatota archaeon]
MRNVVGIIFLFILFSVLFSAGCIQSDSDIEISSITWMSYEAGLQKGGNEGKPILIDFYADWCGPCKQMDATTYENPEVIKAVTESFVAVKVNVDEWQFISYQYEIYRIPTTVYLDSHGNEVYRTIGYRSASRFLTDMEECLNRMS